MDVVNVGLLVDGSESKLFFKRQRSRIKRVILKNKLKRDVERHLFFLSDNKEVVVIKIFLSAQEHTLILVQLSEVRIE